MSSASSLAKAIAQLVLALALAFSICFPLPLEKAHALGRGSDLAESDAGSGYADSGATGNDAVPDLRGGYEVAVIVPRRVLPIRKLAAIGAFHRCDRETAARVNHPAAGSASGPVDDRVAGFGGMRERA